MSVFLSLAVDAQTIPDAPTNLVATASSPFQINLSWSDISTNEAGFKIERSPDGTNFTQIAQVLPNTTSYRNSGLLPSTTYSYRMRAYNSGGDSAFSNLGSAATPALCAVSLAGWGWNNFAQLTAPTGLTGVVSIAFRWGHCLALETNGTIVGWGSNAAGEATPPDGLTGVVAVSAGYYFSLALKSDGTVVGWDTNTFGQTTVPAGLTNVVAISAGQYYGLALKSDGTVVGWGRNADGEATPPTGLAGVVAIAAGPYHALALRSDGTVVSWGSDFSGAATPPEGLTGVVAISAGYSYGLALTSNGTVVAWGDNDVGEATPPPGLSNVVAIAVGYWDGFALKSDGTVIGWGSSFSGAATPPAGLKNVIAIAAGTYDGMAMTSPCVPVAAPSALTATAVSYSQINLSWSDNSSGEDGFKVERSLDGTNFTQIAQVQPNITSCRNTGLFPSTMYFYRVRAYNAGGNWDYSNVASASTLPLCDTTVVGWGNNDYGQEAPPSGLNGVVAIACGYVQSEGLKSDGTVVGWGYYYYATPPAGLTGVVSISAGTFHNLAVKSDGTVVAWGDNYYGQSSVPSGLSNVVAVAAGYEQSLALKSDGTVVGWGTNDYGQATPPAGLSNVVAIAAGGYHSLALKSDGTVVGWGRNIYGATSVPSGLTGVVAIAAGGWHSLALKSDGTIVGWGDNYYGQNTQPAGLTNALAIAAGWVHSLALKSDGTVVGWGYNNYGQTTPPPGLTGVVAIGAGVYHSLALSSVPGAPPSITLAAVSANQVNLSWSNTAGTVSGFKIDRALDSGGSPGVWTQIVAVAGSVTNYSDTGLATNTTYWYRMLAYNACTNSPYSTPISVVTAPPPAPLNLTAVVVGTNQVNLSWINNYPDVVGFTIERALNNGGSPGTWTQIATVAGSVTSYTDTGQVANTAYWYRVRAYNGLGDSPYSNSVIGTIPGGQLITVMQWNIEGHIGNILSNNTAAARAIARIINYNQPDILLFNEINTQALTPAANTAAIIDWVTNNVTYMGSQTGVTFWVAMSSQSDGFIRNGAISRYPILAATMYDDGLRGLHSFRVQLNGTNALQVFHAHIKCCSDDCTRKHTEAQFDADTISGWAAANSLPYIFAGDWNDDEQSPLCAPPNTIKTIREGSGLVEFKPTTLDGEYRTWSTSSASIRFDYLLAASNRLSAASGYVFSTMDWVAHGLYTDASPQNLVNDSQTASDHYCVFAKYFFPSPGFPVTPPNAFASAGYLGGPFSPAEQVYTLSNTNSIPLNWSVTKSASWLTISATNGILVGGASTNITVSINATANGLSVGSYADTIGLASVTINASLTVLWQPPVASFTGSPTNGLEPVTVTFTDTSTGIITNRFWDFGDGGTTNVTTNVVDHTYTAGGSAVGTYDVMLVVSGPGGVSTNTKSNYITVQASPSTINIAAANLQDGSGNLAPTSTVVVLVADTGNNGFADPQSSFSLSLGATWGTDDKVVGLWDLRDSVNCSGIDGALCGQTVVTYTNGIAPGQKLQLYWFPSLALASNVLGVTYYGKYTDTNSPPLDGSDPWQMPPGGSNAQLDFLTSFWGGSNPDAAGRATLLTGVPLTAFENWQIQYFGYIGNPDGAPTADFDGDGQNNMAEFLAGTDPTNSASAFRITSIVRTNNDLRITWMTGPDKTNAVQAMSGGAYATNGFVNIFVVTNTVGPVINYLDSGAATNVPSRYYRIRLVP